MKPIAYSIEPAKEPGYSTIALTGGDGKKKFLHSSIAPSKESEILTPVFEKGEGKTIIVLGCGLGYHLKPLEKIRADVIIIDILEGLDDTVRKTISFSSTVQFITGTDLKLIEDRLSDLLSIEEKSGFLICEHPSSVRLFPEFYTSCRNIVNGIIRSRVGNLATKKKFADIYVRNIAKTISQMAEDIPFSSLYGRFAGIPAFILSSAPSVDAFIPCIAGMKGKGLIICVDSAYPVLSSHGIRPDFVVTSDPQPWISEHLLGIDQTIPLLHSFSAWNPSCLKNPRFLSLTSHPLCQILDHVYPGIIGSFDSKTGTVAGDAIAAAEKMGCSPIYAAGIDFSFPCHIIYSKDSRYNTRFTEFLSSRTRTTETLHMSYVQNSSQKTLQEGIRTRNSFLQYRDRIDRFSAQCSSPVIHLKGKGLSLPSILSISPEEFTALSFPDIQLINNLSTLSTIGSLINLNVLKKFLSPVIAAQAMKESSASADQRKINSFLTIAFRRTTAL